MPTKSTKSTKLTKSTMSIKSTMSDKKKSISLIPSTNSKNGKELSEYQKFMAVGLRKFPGNCELTQKEKMKESSKYWKSLKDSDFLDKTSQLPSHLNEKNCSSGFI